METKNKNERILAILKENSKLSTSMISRKAGVPITTVHNRIKKMCKEGIIKKYTIVLDPKKIGRPILALILINFNYKLLEDKNKEAFAKILHIDGVEELFEVTGDYDLILKVRTKDIETLNEVLTKLRSGNFAVRDTKTMIVLNEISN
jgi:Lrp/AsnC family transcriptional regulator for asnA, asnC and gidA